MDNITHPSSGTYRMSTRRSNGLKVTCGSRYPRVDAVKFVEDSLSRTYPFILFKGYLPQLLLGPLNLKDKSNVEAKYFRVLKIKVKVKTKGSSKTSMFLKNISCSSAATLKQFNSGHKVDFIDLHRCNAFYFNG